MTPSLGAHVRVWLPPIVYMMLIFHFSSESNPVPELTTRLWDKLLHTLEYAGLAGLLCRALLAEGLGAVAALVVAMVLTSAFGASDEYHQLFVQLRDANVRDWIADTIGACTGAIAYTTVRGRRMSGDH